LQVLNPQILGYFIDTAVVGGPQQMLDEASSRLDPLTEQLIERAVDRRLENRTGIHWRKTVERADQILILEQGQVVEYGDRKTLLGNSTSRFSALLKTGTSLR